MSITTEPPTVRRRPDAQGQLQEELRHIRDLVFVRDLLSERGATAADLHVYDAVIERAHVVLAESAKRASARYAAAA